MVIENKSKRDTRWSERIAVGSDQFTKRMKVKMGAMTTGRKIHEIENGFELRESQSRYNHVLDTKNSIIAPEKAGL